jgi:hypothetical protein
MMPLYTQRPSALIALLGGILLAIYVLPTPQYFEWFWCGYYVKLLVSHILREEPYRPVPLAPES